MLYATMTTLPDRREGLLCYIAYMLTIMAYAQRSCCHAMLKVKSVSVCWFECLDKAGCEGRSGATSTCYCGMRLCVSHRYDVIINLYCSAMFAAEIVGATIMYYYII